MIVVMLYSFVIPDNNSSITRDVLGSSPELGSSQKRVAIARAIVLNPKYLFCDEPNSGLDPKTSLVIDELLSGITKEYSMTTIINTKIGVAKGGVARQCQCEHRG
jgi:ABC-type methionine transport system ATPase subunit